jgi:hypothetical protein
MRHTLAIRIMTIAAVPALTAACAGKSGGSTTTNSSTAPTRTSPAGGRKSSLAVDLTFTGTVPLTAKGSAGQCQFGYGPGSSRAVTRFGFSATEADYPGLGDSIYLNEGPSPDKFDVKWAASSGHAWVGYVEGNVAVASDHKSVVFDNDLSGGINQPEHLKGSIACG